MKLTYNIENGEVAVRDYSTGERMWHGKICSRICLKCIAIPNAEDAILLVDPGTKGSLFLDNLLRIRSNGEIVWSAKTPGSHDSFVDFSFFGNGLSATTWNGFRVNVCIDTGEIVSEQFVK